MLSTNEMNSPCQTQEAHDPEAQAQIVRKFFSRLQRASQRILILDYDGTLAPFRVAREQARPYPGVHQAIDRLMRDDRNLIIIVTGRKILDFQAASGFPAGLELWGSHGWEHQRRNGAYDVFPGSERAIAGLIRAEAWLKENGFSEQTELKPGALDFHWRGLPDLQIEPLRHMLLKRMPEIVRGGGVSIQEFDGGMSLRIPGRNKGTAVRTILNRVPANAIAAFLGDDLTDEDGFAAMEEPHLGILVRPVYRETRAHAWLTPPEELLNFFEQWCMVTENIG